MKDKLYDTQDSLDMQDSHNARDSHIKSDDTLKEPKLRGFIVGVKGLSLGISMVVAIGIGIGIGILLKNLFGVFWVFWIGVFWGICAAILNVYKAYKTQMREFDDLAKDPKYSNKE